MGFKKVLVAIDGSHHSYKTLQKAIEHVKDVSGELMIVHVIQSPEKVAPIGDFSAANYNYQEEQKEHERKQGQEILKQAQKEAKKAGINGKTVLLEGNPAKSISHYAEKEHVDLIMVGSHGLGAVKELMVGSVSHKVTHISSIPVLIVK